MAATTRNSTLYTKINVNKYLGKTTENRGRMVPIPFSHTVVSGETGGASAGVQDKVNLCVIPANAMVVDLCITTEDIWASAAVNGTLQLGDSGQADRYLIASEAYTSSTSGGGPIATEGAKHGGLAFAGQNYTPTADTIVQLTWKTANPTVGKTLKGVIWVIPGE